jgi:protein O-GlcNAc transferase
MSSQTSRRSPPEYLRALALYRAGRLRDTLNACIEHLGRAPPYPPTLSLLGRVLYDSGHYREAAGELERSLGIDAGQVDAWLNLAQARGKLLHVNDALAAIDNALRVDPLDAQVNVISAGIALELGASSAGESHARRATQLDPALASGWFNLALALQAQERTTDARAAARRALNLDPGNIPIAGLSAQLDAESGDLASARETLAKALDRHPGHVALTMEQAWVAARANDLPAAADAYARVVAAQPGNGSALSQLIFCKKQLLDWTDLAGLQARFAAGAAAGMPLLTPFSFLSDPSTRARQKQCAATWAAGFAAGGVVTHPASPTAAPIPVPGRRLRIGYLSGDFYQHPTSVLLAGVLEHHDRMRFEVFAYSTGPDDASAMRARIVAAVDHFGDIRDRDPARLAARIRADRLDVLVDLKGYTEGAPTAALATRPALIQVHWIGYPGTMAAPFIDYLLVDRIVVPDAHRADYAEALVRLPHCYQPNDRSRSPSAAPSRESLGFGVDDVVFAGFNAPWKLNAGVFDAWARILAATPRSMLWLLVRNDGDPVMDNARRELANRGIAGERIVFAGRRAEPEYLALFGAADIFLDTWPYNAHTTASDALWMGCPVVTRLGETFAGRVGASLLHAVGSPELIADSTDDYVALAIALASDPDRRALLRAKLLRARTESPLFDVAAITHHVEWAFETMVDQHRDRRRESFEIAGTDKPS